MVNCSPSTETRIQRWIEDLEGTDRIAKTDAAYELERLAMQFAVDISKAIPALIIASADDDMDLRRAADGAIGSALTVKDSQERIITQLINETGRLRGKIWYKCYMNLTKEAANIKLFVDPEKMKEAIEKIVEENGQGLRIDLPVVPFTATTLGKIMREVYLGIISGVRKGREDIKGILSKGKPRPLEGKKGKLIRIQRAAKL